MNRTSNERVSDRRRIDERRRHERLALRAPAEIATEGQDTVIEADTVNVSLGGCSFSGAYDLAVDQEVTVVIMVATRILWARARVVHVAPDRAGVEFLGLTPGPRRTLRSWLGEPGTPRAGGRRGRPADGQS